MSWIFDYFANELNTTFFSEQAAVQAPDMSKFHKFITTFPYEGKVLGCFKFTSFYFSLERRHQIRVFGQEQVSWVAVIFDCPFSEQYPKSIEWS